MGNESKRKTIKVVTNYEKCEREQSNSIFGCLKDMRQKMIFSRYSNMIELK